MYGLWEINPQINLFSLPSFRLFKYTLCKRQLGHTDVLKHFGAVIFEEARKSPSFVSSRSDDRPRDVFVRNS